MKKVTAEEFLELLKSDKALHDSYKTALQEAEGKTAAEVAETLGYQIETSDLQELDDDFLTDVAGGVATDYKASDDLLSGGDLNYFNLNKVLKVKR